VAPAANTDRDTAATSTDATPRRLNASTVPTATTSARPSWGAVYMPAPAGAPSQRASTIAPPDVTVPRSRSTSCRATSPGSA
jgi:hypothetical protein